MSGRGRREDVPKRRFGFAFAPGGRYAAALREDSLGDLELETWTVCAGRWQGFGTGIQAALSDQVLPLSDGRILIRASLGGGHLLAVAQPNRSKDARTVRWSSRTLVELDCAGARFVSASVGDRHTLAFVVTYGDGVTRLCRLLPSDELVRLPVEIAGFCEGGTWLDRRGRQLAVNRSIDGRPTTPIAVDVDSGATEIVFEVSQQSNDRVELYSARSSLLVVRTDAGGAERIGFARLAHREPFWFPEEASAAGGIRALALHPDGERLLLHEQQGVLSRLAIYDVVRRRRCELATPSGCLRGAAVWRHDGISVPWSTPATPHHLLRCPSEPSSAVAVQVRSDRLPEIVAVNGGAGAIEAIAYGGPTWKLSSHLVIALHGGPTDAWRFEYNPLFEALAASGVAVLAINQRGSIGYSRGHASAIRGAWGGPDLDDVTRVVGALAQARGALGGPALLGISYGGYLALLAGCVMPNCVTACIAVSPFLSAKRLYQHGSPMVRRHIDALGGTRELTDDLGPRDVLRLADRLAARCLIIHGRNDDVIPVEQSRALSERLSMLGERRYGDFQYIEVEDGGHDLINGTIGLRVGALICEFLANADGDISKIAPSEKRRLNSNHDQFLLTERR